MMYFDYAAATPLDPEVFAAMQPYFTQEYYNPSALYLPARSVRERLQAARLQVARQLEVPLQSIVFTAGGTEANNLAVQGVLRAFPDGHVVVSAVEHESVLAPAKAQHGAVAAVDSHGTIDLDDLARTITPHTVLVSVLYAQNEVGTVQPLRNVTALVRRIRQERHAAGNSRPLYVHTDACQAGNYLDLHVSRLGVDMMTINGGKLYGPKQSGALYVGAHVRVLPLLLGGGQERGLRSGTENVAACVGLAAALEQAQTRRQAETARLTQLQMMAFDLLRRTIPDATIQGSLVRRLPNNLHIAFPGHDNERLLLQLEAAGVLAAAGSACSAASGEPSHVLRAMGVDDRVAQSSLRFTMGRATTEAEVRTCIHTLSQITKK